jgi:hypothetical protein
MQADSNTIIWKKYIKLQYNTVLGPEHSSKQITVITGFLDFSHH